jgi:hypothetical protein
MLALPASIAGIAAGSIVAPALVSALGLTAALLACGAVVMAYCTRAGGICAGPPAADARRADMAGDGPGDDPMPVFIPGGNTTARRPLRDPDAACRRVKG